MARELEVGDIVLVRMESAPTMHASKDDENADELDTGEQPDETFETEERESSET